MEGRTKQESRSDAEGGKSKERFAISRGDYNFLSEELAMRYSVREISSPGEEGLRPPANWGCPRPVAAVQAPLLALVGKEYRIQLLGEEINKETKERPLWSWRQGLPPDIGSETVGRKPRVLPPHRPFCQLVLAAPPRGKSVFLQT
jgi:hypothetical protein